MLHFLSDLHLSPETPGSARLFRAYLAGEARRAERIFILGDLFEAWPGDDALDDAEDSFGRDVADGLRALVDSGTGIAILRGNRDFLLGEYFTERSGAALLPDPYLLVLPEARFVLTHGDALCAGDAAYQSFRARVRTPAWRDAFLGKPLGERKALAASMRRQSEAARREKTAQSMDIDTKAADDVLRHYAYATMIHGHTHRPGRHEHLIDGTLVERWVLADWREKRKEHEGRGEYLAWDGRRFNRHALACSDGLKAELKTD